jgi:hypothetical protein
LYLPPDHFDEHDYLSIAAFYRQVVLDKHMIDEQIKNWAADNDIVDKIQTRVQTEDATSENLSQQVR